MPYLQQQQAQPATDVNVNASDLSAQIQAQVAQQQQQAKVGAQAAKGAADRAAQGASDVTVITKNGRTITVRTPRPGAPLAPLAPIAPIEGQEPVIATSSGTSIPADFPRDIPQRVENLGYALFLMIAIIAVGKPLVRVFGNIIERRAIKPAMPQEFGARLERIEQGIESVSIEVERISESQRYLLKVQSPTPDRVELPRSAS